MYNSYQQASQIIPDIAPSYNSINRDMNPLYQFVEDMTVPIQPKDDDAHLFFDGYKIYTTARWPFCATQIPDDCLADVDWLLDMYDATQSPGVGAYLFVVFKQHKLMDCVPHFLANPAFMSELGEKLKTVLVNMICGKARNDVMFRYQRLLQLHPIMLETMHWLDEFRQDQIGSKLFRFGIPNALGFVKPENVTAEMVHESITNAITNADKRIAKPTNNHFTQMYDVLLKLEGHDLVEQSELVRICLLNWTLGFAYIKAKKLSFNEALSVVMTFIYKRESSVSPYDNYNIVEILYNTYGPSDQWPTLEHVVQYVNGVTSNRAKRTPSTPPSSLVNPERKSAFD